MELEANSGRAENNELEKRTSTSQEKESGRKENNERVWDNIPGKERRDRRKEGIKEREERER
jgi:hypothetical protein